MTFPQADPTKPVTRTRFSGVTPPFVKTAPDDSRWLQPLREIESYAKLVEQVARLASFNTRYQFFFRGHDRLTRRDNGMGNTVTPTIWRSHNRKWLLQEYVNLVTSGEFRSTGRVGRSTARYAAERADHMSDFELNKAILEFKSNDLLALYETAPGASHHIANLMRESPLVQWALLQHYECCATPLLDVTRSLHVASSFALMPREGEEHHDVTGYVVVLGLPHQREALTTNHRQGILNIELLGLTPPDAKRPLMQEAYLACGFDWWRTFCLSPYSFGEGDVVEFSGRIAAILKVKNKWDEKKARENSGYRGDFWEKGIGAPIEESQLFPDDTDEFFHFLDSHGFHPLSHPTPDRGVNEP